MVIDLYRLQANQQFILVTLAFYVLFFLPLPFKYFQKKNVPLYLPELLSNSWFSCRETDGRNTPIFTPVCNPSVLSGQTSNNRSSWERNLNDRLSRTSLGPRGSGKHFSILPVESALSPYRPVSDGHEVPSFPSLSNLFPFPSVYSLFL